MQVSFCQTFLPCAVLCCAVPCCAVLCCAVLCRAVLCCAVLCCAVAMLTQRAVSVVPSHDVHFICCINSRHAMSAVLSDSLLQCLISRDTSLTTARTTCAPSGDCLSAQRLLQACFLWLFVQQGQNIPAPEHSQIAAPSASDATSVPIPHVAQLQAETLPVAFQECQKRRYSNIPSVTN